MAITTIDGIIAGMLPPQDFLKIGTAHKAAGMHHSHAYALGRPGAAVAPNAGLSGEALTSYDGQIPFTNPASGNTYLARFQAAVSANGCLILYDRLWHNSGIVVTSTGEQAINSVEFPPRDRDETINGENVLIGVEVSTVMGAGTPTWTMGYTNSKGVNGRSIVTPAQTTTMSVGSFIPIPLMAGDTGVKSIQTWQQSATMTSGVYHLVAYRILARLQILANIGDSLDAITGGFVRLYNNTVPFLLWLPTATALVTVNGQLIVTQG